MTGSQHYLTSTPTSARPPNFRPASDVPLDADDFLLGSSDRRRRRNAPPPANNFSTRSLPRSAKDFSSLTYRPAYDEQPSQEADECCERRKQMKILQNLAREMNWSLPLKTDSVKADQSEEASCSALSISDTLLVNNDNQLPATLIVHDQSLTRDFSYLTKPPPAYPRSKIPSNDSRNSSAASSVRRTKVRRALSRSHPDLSKLGKELKPSLSVTAPVTIADSSWRNALRQK